MIRRYVLTATTNADSFIKEIVNIFCEDRSTSKVWKELSITRDDGIIYWISTDSVKVKEALDHMETEGIIINIYFRDEEEIRRMIKKKIITVEEGLIKILI